MAEADAGKTYTVESTVIVRRNDKEKVLTEYRLKYPTADYPTLVSVQDVLVKHNSAAMDELVRLGYTRIELIGTEADKAQAKAARASIHPEEAQR